MAKKISKQERQKQRLQKALVKKAVGYQQDEVVEEYVCSPEGELKLAKRKVTKKFVPPDIPAVKMLLGEYEVGDLSNMTEQELENEKKRLLADLAREEEEE